MISALKRGLRILQMAPVLFFNYIGDCEFGIVYVKSDNRCELDLQILNYYVEK